VDDREARAGGKLSLLSDGCAMTLFEHALMRLSRAARANPDANNGAARKRLRKFVHGLLKAELS